MKPAPLLDVTVASGKYRVIQEADGILHALRHGEPWRALAGDNLVLALAQEVRVLREKLAAVNEVAVDLGEVIVQTAACRWDEVKDQNTGLTFEMVNDWAGKLREVLQQ